MTQNYSWQIRQSKLLWRLLALGYVFAVGACIFNSLSLIIRLSLVILVMLHGFFTLKRLSCENWQLDYDEQNGWQLLEFSYLTEIEILPSTVLSRYFVFLHYSSKRKKCYRLIFKDALLVNINDFRQLIVMLKTY